MLKKLLSIEKGKPLRIRIKHTVLEIIQENPTFKINLQQWLEQYGMMEFEGKLMKDGIKNIRDLYKNRNELIIRVFF